MYFDDLQLASTGGTPYSGWNMTWSDEFNGTSVDANTWTYDIGTGNGPGQPGQGWGNNELEYYTSRTNNVYEAGGLLHIVAQQESNYNGSGADYTSARVKSQGLIFAEVWPHRVARASCRWALAAGPPFGCWARISPPSPGRGAARLT